MLLAFALFDARIPFAGGQTADVGFHTPLAALIHPSHFDVIALAVAMLGAAP